jgi:glucose-1-phosphate thymidylyltransferase
VVALSPNGKITRFQEKPDHPFSEIAATALYGFQPSALLQLNDYLAASDDVDSPGHFVSHLVSKMEVYGWFLPGELIDYGHASVLAKQLDH